MTDAPVAATEATTSGITGPAPPGPKLGRGPVTVLGLGPMGSALAGALLDAGHSTTVWNRTASKAEPLAARGAHRAPSVAAAVAASPVTIVCLLNYDAVHHVLEPAAPGLAGRTLINLTADSPDRARRTADWAAAHGIDYLDGSIMSTAASIGGPDASLLLSGPEQLFRAYRPVLASLGGQVSYVGAEPDRAAAYDVALLDAFWTAMNGVIHAFALARAQQIPAGELLPHLEGILHVTLAVAPGLAANVDAGSHAGDDSALSSNAAGMAHIIHAADGLGVDSSVLAAAKTVADRAIAAGYGKDDFSRVVDVLTGAVSSDGVAR